MQQISFRPDTFEPSKIITVVAIAKALKSRVIISAGSYDANAESYLELLSLWAERKDSAFQITIEGEDEQYAVEKIEALFYDGGGI